MGRTEGGRDESREGVPGGGEGRDERRKAGMKAGRVWRTVGGRDERRKAGMKAGRVCRTAGGGTKGGRQG